jgi:hypothetical protein
MTWLEEPRLELITRSERFEATRLQVEVAGLFAPYCGTPWEEVERYETTMRARYLQDAKDRLGMWLARQGKTGAQVNRERRKVYREIVVGQMTCTHCGREFSVDKWRGINGTTSVCSKECEVAVMRAGRYRKAKRYDVDGESLTLAEWSRKRGISVNILWQRINRGWDIRRALGLSAGPAKSSKFVGVSWSKACHKWQAYASIGCGRRKQLGCHDTEESAARAVAEFRAGQEAAK